MATQFTSISEGCEMVKFLAKVPTNFKTQLNQLQDTLQFLQYVFDKRTSNEEMTSQTISLIIEAKKLVCKCPKIKWNLIKKFSHARKLNHVNYKLSNICLRGWYDLNESEADPVTQTDETVRETIPETRSIPGSAPTSATPGTNTSKRNKLGWRVTRLPRAILTFDQPLKKLKSRVLVPDDDDRSSSVVVVSAPAGCGKTFLVNVLCHDPDIQAKYGHNIFYVKIPKTPNFTVMVDDLLNPNHSSEAAVLQSDEDAKDHLEKFLRQVKHGPILLVLDGVQSDLYLKNFKFKIRGYKILVTSKMIFPQYDMFRLDPLSDEDAKSLFELSFYGESVRMLNATIDDDLVNQMVKCCKKHPLTVSMVGSSLSGRSDFVCKSVMKSLSQGEWVLDTKDAQRRLQLTVEQLDEEFKNCTLVFKALDEEFKQCLLDFGLFPKDRRIPACALLDMWMNLYDHDDMGKDTLIKIFQLADRNLVSSITIGEEANAIVNYCEHTFVTQEDWQRELAIHFISKEPVSQRTRLIIDIHGNDMPAQNSHMKEVLKARVLSISTGESFYFRWCNMNAPEVEVMVLNIMSETYYLPHFLENMHRLKVLNVTNHGLHPTIFVNFHIFSSLISLTRIRFEHVALSLMSTSILALVNLRKLSFIKCTARPGFEKLSTDNPEVWPRLVEIEIDSCQDLLGFPLLFCNSVHLEKLSVTNCNEMIQIPEEFGKLTSLQTLSLRSCTKLEKLPDSISRLKKLSILDVSDCLSLSELPENIGELGGLRTIYMKGCIEIHELPSSVKDLSQLQVFCNEEISHKWHDFPNVKIPVVEEDRLFTLTEEFSYSCF